MTVRRVAAQNHLLWSALIGMVVVFVAGCQSYEPAPLDMERHGEAFDKRLIEIEPLSAFVDRLSQTEMPTPERLDLSDGISEPEGEVIALFYNADLRLARAQAGIALATYETAGLWEDPEFGFDGAELLSPSGPFEFGVTLSLTIPISGRLDVERDVAASAYSTELLRIVDAEWNTRTGVRLAWAEWSVAAAQLNLLRDSIGQIERITSITDQLESAGELTRVDARLIRAELIQLRTELVAAEAKEGRARMVLLGLLGVSPKQNVVLHPALQPAEGADLAEDLERLVRQNPTLAVARNEYQTAEESLRLEIRRQYPDLTIGGGYGSEDRDDRLLLGIPVPVPIFNGNRAGIAEACAKRTHARAVAETTYERIVSELSSAQIALTAAQRQRATLESELVPMLDQQSAEVEQLADLGEVDTLVLLETISRRVAAKSQLLEVRLAEVAASLDIVRLIGPNAGTGPAPVQQPDSPLPNPESQSAGNSAGGVK